MPRIARFALALALVACGKTTRDAPQRQPDPPPAPTAPAVIVQSTGIKSFAIDRDETVYFTEASGRIRKQPAAGGDGVVLTTSAAPSTIVVGGGGVYWIDDPGKSFVRKVSIDGGDSAVVATDEHLKVWGLAASADAVYWATYFTVTRVPFAKGEAPSIVASGNGIMELAVSPTHVATSEVIAKQIRASAMGPSGGKSSLALATAWTYPSPLAIDDTHAYWVSGAKDAELVEASLGAPMATPPPVATARCPIVVDADAVYWAANGAVKRQAKSGGAPRVMAKVAKAVGAIAVDGRYLYWSTDTEIVRVPKT